MTAEPKSAAVTPTYYRVSPRIWRHREWSDETKLLACYLLTCKHRTIEGLYLLPQHYITGDLKWSPERLAEPFAQLLSDDFIRYDEDCQCPLAPRCRA
jgi:hypothetical protein